MKIIATSFTPEQLLILAPSLALIFISLIFYLKNKFSIALVFLMLGAFGLRLFMTVLDPFLNEWDERYHALVAKNMMLHPFTPTLWPKAILPYDYKEWCCNFYWVHKQPLFMWQMALSMKIFGVNEVAMRLPSAVMNTLQVGLTYRLGTLVHDRRLGFIAAFLLTFSYFALEQVSGSMGREHNDVAFYFYLTASFWALAEYLQKPKSVYLIGIGVFSGLAILNKWLVGLLVYAGWFLGVLLSRAGFWQQVKKMVIAGFITVAVFLPWQLYIFTKFPLESAHEFSFNRRHIWEVLDGHSGDRWYYFTNNYILYGEWSWIFILLGILLFAIKIKNSILKFALPAATIVLYIFFTIAKTKFVSFVFVASFVFIFLGMVLWMLQEQLSKLPAKIGKPVMLILLVLAGFYTFRHRRIESYHARNQPNYFEYGPQRVDRIRDAQILRRLSKELPADYLIFNTTQPIEVMFYTNNIAYFWLGPEDYNRLKKEGYRMAAMKTPNHPIPFYLEQDTSVRILDPGLKN